MPPRHFSVTDRIDLILRGRRPYTWAKTVALSRGTMNRLLQGNLPDPEKLVPACRVENVSLTWLLDGAGAPYVVYIASSADDHATIAQQMLDDEPDLMPIVVTSGQKQHLAFVTTVRATNVDGTVYQYRAVAMIGGASAAADLPAAMLQRYAREFRRIQLPDDDLRRFASGYMGAYEFLALFDANSAPVDFDQVQPAIAESRAGYSADDAKAGLIADVESLDPDQAELVRKMISGLVPKKA